MGLNVAIDEKNEAFLDDYKKLGYPTKTAMINDALVFLKRQRAKELRAARRLQMLDNYAKAKQEFVWERVDGEDFKD